MIRTQLAFLLALAACSSGTPADPPSPPEPSRVLVFSRTEGFRHGSIEAGLEAVRAIAAARGAEVLATEDDEEFAQALAQVDAVVFLNTTGDVLDAPGEAALRAFVEDGGGWLGIHAAADTEYGWPWYGTLVGARFASHPAVQQATLRVVEASHPATSGLPDPWVRTDEWYDFQARPTDVSVLLRLDEDSYSGGAMGADHPIAWAHIVGAGRAVYTGLGHTSESYAEPLVRTHLDGALCWAGRLEC